MNFLDKLWEVFLMADRQRLELRNIARLNQFTDEKALEPTQVPVLENAVLDIEAGKAIKRGAIEQSIYPAPNTGVFQEPTNLFSVQLEGVDYIVAKFGTELYVYNGSTWDLITGTTWTALNATAKLQTQIFADRLYLTDGVTPPKVTDLINNSGEMEIDPPETDALDNYHRVGGNLTPQKYYKYVITHKTEEGDESNPSTPFTHFIGNTFSNYGFSTDNTYKTLKFSGIPTTNDTRIVRRSIYRTEGDGDIYYFLTNIDVSETEFTDGKADTDLDKSRNVQYKNIPTLAKDLASHEERMFIAGGTLTQKNFTELPYDPVESVTATTNIGGGSWVIEEGTRVGAPMPSGTYTFRICIVSDDNIQSVYREKGITLVDPLTNEIRHTNMPLILDPSNIGQTYKVYVNYNDDVGGGDSGFLYDADFSDALNRGEKYFVYVEWYLTSADDFFVTPVYEDIHYPNSVMWSDIGQPVDFRVTSVIRVFPDDGDLITAIYDDRDGLIVFKENSICKIHTQGNPVNWRVVKITEEVGCDDINSIIKVEDRYYFQQHKQVYLFPVSAEALSLAVKDDLNDLDTVISTAYSSKYHWLMIGVTRGSVYKILVFDEVARSWYTWVLDEFYVPAMCEVKHGSERGDIIFCNEANTQTMVYNPTGTKDYDPFREGNYDTFQMKIKSKIWLTPAGNFALRFTKLFANYKKTSGYSVTHSINSETYIDSTGSGETYIEVSNIDIQHVASFQYEIYGVGLEEFEYAQIEHHITRRRLNAI